MASSRPSFPAPSEPNLRRLGIGGPGRDRPLKAQMVVAVVGVLVVIAVPLYFLRKPSAAESSAEERSAAERSRLIRTTIETAPAKSEVKLAAIQRVKCSAAPNRDGNEGHMCDRIPTLETQFEKAVKDTSECAPHTGKEGSINYVLSVDFSQKRLSVFPGASGTWKGPQAKSAAQCVLRAMDNLQWDSLSHNYRFYMLALLASYPAPDPMVGVPEFE